MQSLPLRWIWRVAPLGAFLALGCSAGGDGSSLVVGSAASGGAPGSGGASTPGSGGLISGGGGKSDTTSSVQAHIEKDHVRVEVFLLGCVGTCADVVAVPKNGVPPYTFEWEDGSTEPAHHLCPSSNTTYAVSVTDRGVTTGEFPRPPEAAHAQVTANVFDCSPIDAGAHVPDAGPAPVCESGDTVKGDPLGGTTTYFRQGAAVPAGRYRISYVDGCMTYGLNWTIHNIIPPGWLIAGTLTALPGVSGTGFVNFEECVAASRQFAPIEIDFAGGQLGIWNNDYPLSDNVAGIDGRNPEWCLTAL